MDKAAEASANSLGLDLDAFHIKDNPEPAVAPSSKSSSTSEIPAAMEHTDTSKATVISTEDAAEHNEPMQEEPSPEEKKADIKEKKKPYVNPERVKTGGAQRDKLSEEELVERMTRIREQNEKIKQRRIDVQADEDAFKKTQEAERIKVAKNKKMQENVDRTREQNARRKLDKIQSREWDSGKQGREWKPTKEAGEGTNTNRPPQSPIGIRGIVRGGGAGRGGRGRGRGAAPTSTVTEKPTEAQAAAEATIASS